MSVIIIDNYDSFAYNIFQALGSLGAEPLVFRNDEISLDELEKLQPGRIVISPGPCTPLEAGISNQVVLHFGSRLPILGICLGHQCIGQVYGGRVIRANQVMHGKTSLVHHNQQGIFKGLPTPFTATRYHSLVVEPESLPAEIQVTALTADGVIMGIRHRRFPVWGIQCHPESYLTPAGPIILANFLQDAAWEPVGEDPDWTNVLQTGLLGARAAQDTPPAS